MVNHIGMMNDTGLTIRCGTSLKWRDMRCETMKSFAEKGFTMKSKKNSKNDTLLASHAQQTIKMSVKKYHSEKSISLTTWQCTKMGQCAV